MSSKRVIVSADDFGLSKTVNEAVEIAHRDGLLSTASLMVAGAAADDAVRRAREMPGLHVGLHVVVIEGPSVLREAELTDATGRFPADQMRLGLRYAFDGAALRRLRGEITAQFAAFAATGLRLDHVNAHKHMHLHPVVGRMVIQIGQAFGLRAIRIPMEPSVALAACGEPVGRGGKMLEQWTRLLRWQARRARLLTNDQVFGIAWSGHMTEDRIARLAPHVPPGLTEIYFHPASQADDVIEAVMPDYDHAGELATLLSPRVRQAFASAGLVATSYSDERLA